MLMLTTTIEIAASPAAIRQKAFPPLFLVFKAFSKKNL
jgi:hypothetical protein